MDLIKSAADVLGALSHEGTVMSSGLSPTIQDLTTNVADLHRQIVKIGNLNLALIEVLRDRVGFTDQELIEKINLIERQPAPTISDVQHPAASETCTRCERAYSKRHNRCLYCGNVNEQTSLL